MGGGSEILPVAVEGLPQGQGLEVGEGAAPLLGDGRGHGGWQAQGGGGGERQGRGGGGRGGEGGQHLGEGGGLGLRNDAVQDRGAREGGQAALRLFELQQLGLPLSPRVGGLGPSYS